jgi:ABC-type transport system involved in multi-copper enzyme maturation permease subunit
MWQEFFRFDLRYQLRQPMLWLVTVALAAMAFATAGSTSFRIGAGPGGIGNVHLNAPVVIANQLGVLSMISMLLVTVFIAGAVLRDSETGIADLLYATPLRKLDYLLGRFLAGFAVCLLIFGVITLAMMSGSRLPSIDPERLGAFSLWPYVWSFAVLVVPNLLFVAALLTLLAAVTRSMIMVYTGVVAVVVLWAMAAALGAGNGSVGGGGSMSVLLDPFGVRVLTQLTRYFNGAQLNTELPPLSGLLLANRLLWTGVALAMFGATVALFKPQRAGTASRSHFRLFGRAPAQEAADVAPPSAPASAQRVQAVRRIAPRFDASTSAAQAWHVLRFDVRAVMRSVPFLVMLLLAIANFIANHTIGGMRFDSVPYPLTRLMLEDIAGSMNAVLVLVLLFYSGELVHRDRQLKMADVSDATPLPNWVPLLSRAGALGAVTLVFLAAGALVAIVIQLVKGGATIEFGLYVQGTLINAVYFMLAGLALLALQALANNKYVGYLLGAALLVSGSLLDLEHRLLSFASLPPLAYSDLNGYGHFLTGWSWFAVYWTLFGAALLFLAQAFRVRGPAPGWRLRLASGLRGLRGGAGLGLALSVTAFAVAGGWIFYNTNVLNRYESHDGALDTAADYEKRYRAFLALPNPSVTAVRADVAIYPAQRRVTIAGSYQLRNKTGAPLDSLRVQMDPAVHTRLTGLPPHTVVLDDRRHGMTVLKLREPLAPGASLPFGFTVEVSNPGFTNSGAPDTINRNGTMFTSENFFPKLGYVQASEVEDRNERRKRGLGEPHRMPALDDPAARKSNFWKLFGFDADLVDFETTVSTSADQVALAPGELVRSWEKEGRRYYHYRMDQPILPFFVYQSGRWEVARADWHGVPVSVHYDARHAYNVGSMIKGTQRALDYYSANFGPYPHKDVRITEFPLYQQYARSFPGMIPFSESLGFVNDLRNPDGVDHVFYVTAHEVAHQWWGDQVIAANSQGSMMVTESVAEYAALMTLEKEFGASMPRHILRFDLDQYLAGRGKELVAEQPLVSVENQLYIAYRKGSMVFYRLREEIGEAALNRALKAFVTAHRYQTGSYITSRDLLAAIRAETPADKQELLTDLFERIVLYDNRVTTATARQRADGQWDVTMQLHLAKLQADGKGKETVRSYDEPVELAVFGKGERVLMREKRSLAGGDASVTVTVKEKPSEVGVDPYNILIDRMPGDNRKQVSLN